MTVEFNIGEYTHRGKVISTVVMRERNTHNYDLDVPKICFVIELPSGVITYQPIKDCRIVPNIFKRFINYVREIRKTAHAEREREGLHG